MGNIIKEILVFLWNYLIFGIVNIVFWFVVPVAIFIAMMIIIGERLGEFGLLVGIFIILIVIIYVMRPLWDKYSLEERLANALKRICF